MTPRLKSTRAARDLIKAHEPFLATAERRGKRWVVGYGHTAAAKEGVTLKPEDAELLLIYDVMRAEQTLDASIGAEMAAPMRDALVSFALSVGLRAFKVSDVARLARDGRHREAAAAIETWVRAEQDGRLVVSDRLVARRAAEKALYLTALEDSAAVITPPVSPVQAAPAPEAQPETTQEEPEDTQPVATEDDGTQEAAQADAEDMAVDGAPAEAVEAADEADVTDYTDEADEAALVELDIAFELPDDADTLTIPVEAAPEAEEADADPVAENDTLEPVDQDAETGAEPVREEPAVLAVTEEAPSAPSEEVKAAQDAAIAQVMARMAKQVSASIATTAPEAAEETVQLGYSFLSTAHVELSSRPAQPAAPEAPRAQVQPSPASTSLFSAPSVPLSPLQSSLQVSTIKVTPIAPEALPQAASEDVITSDRAAELADREDAISVDVSADADDDTATDLTDETRPSGLEVFSAPPHPALAPASAPGLSGDVEGPDHPDKDVDDVHTDIHEDVEVLDPAVVSGGGAAPLEDAEPSQRRGGDVMFISSLALGGVMVGLGGWDIAANMDAYMELGLAYSPLGPTVFGAGVLLSAASAWFIIGRRNEK